VRNQFFHFRENQIYFSSECPQVKVPQNHLHKFLSILGKLELLSSLLTIMMNENKKSKGSKEEREQLK
jgi:hypothetical protein